MATTQLSSFHSLRLAVPITTALFGVLGASTGLYGYLAPGPEPAKAFGFQPTDNIDTNSEADTRQRAYIQVHGIRNFSNGLGLLGLLTFWKYSETCRSSPVAAAVMPKVFAILMATGITVGVADGLILRKYRESDGLSSQAKEATSGKSAGHISIMLPVLALSLGWWYY